MTDCAPYIDELREAERDARMAAVFYDVSNDGPVSRAEVSQEQIVPALPTVVMREAA